MLKVERRTKRVRAKVMPCEVYSRVVGYYRPVSNWNIGKRQESRKESTLSWGPFDQRLFRYKFSRLPR